MMLGPSANFKEGDYVSPNLHRINLDFAFPRMLCGLPSEKPWNAPEIGIEEGVSHRWYTDNKHVGMGWMNRDEVHILYNWALQFRGRRGLEVGCFLGWSTAHILAAGVDLDVIDPIIGTCDFQESIEPTIQAVGTRTATSPVRWHSGMSPQMIVEYARANDAKWDFICIDGDHSSPSPLLDAAAAERYAGANAAIIFHDAYVPDVAEAVRFLSSRGWSTRFYQTTQGMAAAFRGDVKPVSHSPDPAVKWRTPLIP
jgi:predicted O-methyltransferase YrrM